MCINKSTFVFLSLIICFQLASAVSIEMDIKENFYAGDELSFNYTFNSETSQEIEYLVIVKCPEAPQALLNVTKLNLKANTPITKKYIDMSSISKEIEPQTCTATVGIISPEEVIEEKTFRIVTDPSFEVRTLTCEDEDCLNKKRVFILNETIYLDFESEVENPAIRTILFSPDNITKEITLPYSFKLEQTGDYKLESSFFKEGYKTIEEEIFFGVLEKPANIHKGFLPPVRNEITQEQNIGFRWFSFILILLILGLIIFGIVYFLKHKDKFFKKTKSISPKVSIKLKS